MPPIVQNKVGSACDIVNLGRLSHLSKERCSEILSVNIPSNLHENAIVKPRTLSIQGRIVKTLILMFVG